MKDPTCLNYSIVPITDIKGLMPEIHFRTGKMPVYALLIEDGAEQWHGSVIEDLYDLQEALDNLDGPFTTKESLIESLHTRYHSELISREHFN